MSLVEVGHWGPQLKVVQICAISGFRYKVDENCAFLGYYAASSGNSLPRQVKIKLAQQLRPSGLLCNK